MSDEAISQAIQELWSSDPPSKSLGLPKLHAAIRRREPSWACSERRIRKIRADLLDKDREVPFEVLASHPQAGAPAATVPGGFKGANYRNYGGGPGGDTASMFMAPGLKSFVATDAGGWEAELIPEFKLKVMTGRSFSRSQDGEWVLDVPARKRPAASEPEA